MVEYRLVVFLASDHDELVPGARNRIPGMRAHLEGCPGCHEDYDSLRELVQDESNS